VEALFGVFPKSGKRISLGVLRIFVRVLFDEPFSGNHDWHAGLCHEVVTERAEQDTFQLGAASGSQNSKRGGQEVDLCEN
jgi:hypothetical protein